jgi:putative flavoprotein involved in K+ transport
MNRTYKVEEVETLVIGGGQAGLSVGYHLAQRRLPFVILDANERIGDAWRKRWDSLRLFTPARFNGLTGMPFPSPAHIFPTKDETADYLEAYAARFELPVRRGVKVDRLSRKGNRFVATADGRQFLSDNVVVATGYYQRPWVPLFARELDANILQLHSSAYRNPSQLQDGGVLVVGAGNSGFEIASENVAEHSTWLSGRDIGQIPFRPDSVAARFFFLPAMRFLAHHVLNMGTPLGRRLHPKLMATTSPVVRIKPRDLAAAGVKLVPKMAGVRQGLPQLANGEVLEVTNVIWCTGFKPDFSWIHLPIFGEDGKPKHERGIVANQPGLYFVGLFFLYAMSSSLLTGVGRDAKYIAKAIASSRVR